MKELLRFQFYNRVVHLSALTAHLIIIVFGLAAFANVIGYPFVHDDIVFILQNPSIGRWDNILEAFLSPSIPLSFQGLVNPYYRPMLEVYYRLQYFLFGFDARAFHAFNVLIHIANGLLVYTILRRLLKAEAAALLIAIIFVVHPVQTEAVACIAGVSNVLCGFFSLVSIYLYIRSSCASPVRGRIVFFVLSLISFALALLTKEQAVFVFPIFILYEIFLADRRKIRSIVPYHRLAVLGVALMGYLLFRQVLFGSLTNAVFENVAELKLRLLTLPHIVEMFMGILLFPVGLHYYRSINILDPFVLPVLLLIFLIVGAWIILGKLAGDDRKKVFFGLGWFLILIFPALNIVPLVNEYSWVAASEHALYLPMIGFLIVLYVGISFCLRNVNSISAARWMAPASIVFIVLLSVMTIRQNVYWRGEIPLFERVIAFERQLGRVHILLAKAYFFNGRVDDAIVEFIKAENIIMNYARKAATPKARRFYEGLLKGIYFDRAQCYLSKHDYGGALNDNNHALALDSADSIIYMNRALVFLQMGKLPEGVRDLEEAVRLNPGNLSAANNLSICYIQEGKKAQAQRLLEQILLKDPSFEAARRNLEKLKLSLPSSL